MRFTALPLEGAWLIDVEPIRDHRGFNARAFCREELAAHGCNVHVAQCNIIHNPTRGTIRGLHWQVAPMAEQKLFRVTRGSLWDVIVDMRPGSPTFGQWTSVELTASSHRMLLVPEGFAQGFQTLEDDTELFYQVSAPYSPAHGRGMRYDDPAVGIEWPLPVTEISEKDRSWPLMGSLAG